jgi:hypothetical protein
MERDAVQKGIKLTEKQKKQIDVIRSNLHNSILKLGDESRAARQQLREQQGGDVQAQNVLNQSVAESTRALQQSAEQSILRVLDREQRRRLEEIKLQLEGPMAFTREDFQERLNLSPDQVETIVPIVASGRAEVNKLANLRNSSATDGDGNALGVRVDAETKDPAKYKAWVEGRRQAAMTARSSTMQQINRILTKKQRAKYESFLGEPFDVTKLRTSDVSKDPATNNR